MHLRLREGGWLRVTDLPGWESHTVTVRAAIVDGEPRVVALHLDPLETPDTPDTPATPALTGIRLRSLPLHDIATVALRVGHLQTDPGVGRALAAIARRKPAKHDPRAVTTVEQVAEVWLLARDSGKPPRAEVVRRLNITDRTADRYIKRARARGLLPADNRKADPQ
jgi:hypothetical protein